MLATLVCLPISHSLKAQLIISQYYEGASNDKCIEIYNTTNSAVSLTGYNLKLYSNGSTSATTMNLSGTISACGVFVVCNSSYSSATVGYTADQTTGSLSFTGDDAIGLYNGSTLLDIFGDIGCDPGTEWTSLSPGTSDGNFVRSGSTCTGVTTDPSGTCGVNSFTTFTSSDWTSTSLSGTTDLGSHTSSCCGCPGPVSEPTTETTLDSATPSCLQAIINWTASTTADNVIVVVSTATISATPTDQNAYTASAVYGSGETIGANQYVVYNGSGTSVTVTGLTAGTTYNYAIFGYDGATVDCEENYLTGGNFGSFTTLTSCATAQITSLLINSCNGTAEGTDELIVIENGSTDINIDDIEINLPNSTWCNNGCTGVDGVIVNNPTFVADLNAMAGCTPDLFVYADPIPAGATIIIFTGDPPSTVLDFSNNCGAPNTPVYVLFLDNTSTIGNFANSGTSIKTITIDFGNGETDAVSYLPDDVSNVDGGSINYDDAGTPTYYTSTDCVYPLDLRLTQFNGERSDGQVVLTWSAYTLPSDVRFFVERSADGIDYTRVAELMISSEYNGVTDYGWVDDTPLKSAVAYYRLALEDEAARIFYSNAISILTETTWIYFHDGVIDISTVEYLDDNSPIRIYSLNGALIYEGYLAKEPFQQVVFNQQGIFYVEIPDLNFRSKIGCFGNF